MHCRKKTRTRWLPAMFFLIPLLSSSARGGQITVTGTIIDTGSSSLVAVSGSAANGIAWEAFVTGSAPCAYFDLDTGALMVDPKVRSLNLFDFKYGTSSTVTAGTPGPFVFSTGTGPGAVSTSEVSRTLPAGTWAFVNTFAARFAATVSIGNTATLATSGGNIASTDGWLNLGWNFGVISPSLANQQSKLYSSNPGEGFRTAAAGGDLLGYGAGIGMFTWIAAGGTQSYGVVVPVRAVPEPSFWTMAGVGLAAAFCLRRLTAKP